MVARLAGPARYAPYCSIRTISLHVELELAHVVFAHLIVECWVLIVPVDEARCRLQVHGVVGAELQKERKKTLLRLELFNWSEYKIFNPSANAVGEYLLYQTL